MGLLSFFKRAEDNKTAAKPVAEGLDAVQQLRLRARRRLIGAAVLVAAGVIAFPLVFETQPRPVPVDLPIEIPRKDALPPLTVPAATAPAASAERHAAAPAEQGSGIVNEVPSAVAPVAEPVKPAEAPRTASLSDTRKEAVSKPEPKAEAKLESRRPAEKPADKSQDKAHARQQAEQARDADAARAQALLEGREVPKPADRKVDTAAGARFIVQVGAFAEAKAAQDVRGKVEKLGLKTYTQAIETPEGKRIRVRVGPFASREEADRAAAKLRGGGLAGTVLTL